MERMMKMKMEAWAEKAACKATGSCPQYDPRPSSGFIPCISGFADDLPCSNVDQMSFINIPDMGYSGFGESLNQAMGNDIWGWVDPQNGDEYAIVGLSGATAFVRVTDPSNPVPVGIMYTQTDASSWRDIKVIGNYAYVVSEASNHGMQVYDLTRLRGRNSIIEDEPDTVHSGFGQAHNIVANPATNFVYGVGSRVGAGVCSGGLYVLDVSDPTNPTVAGCYGGDGYVHDAECVIYNGPDTEHAGKEICFCYNEDTFTIVDVDDKSNMNMLSRTGYSGSRYTHQGAITTDHTVVLLDDEQDEMGANPNTKTYIWDVTDLDNPVLMNTYVAAVESIDHNQYIVGDLTYQANYESGMRILQIDQANFELNEVAYFDVFPSRDSANFFGSWSLYPYFPSGNIIINSIDYGLFVARPNQAAIREQIAQNKAKSMRSRTILEKSEGAICPNLQEYALCEAELVC